MSIHEGNYEAYLLSYLDGELDAAEAAELEAFLTAHPAQAEELRLLRSLKLDPADEVPFPSKQSLYREETPQKPAARVAPMRWLAAAAAVAVIAAAGYFLMSRRSGVRPAGDRYALRTPAHPSPARPSVTDTPATAPTEATQAGRPAQPLRNHPAKASRKTGPVMMASTTPSKTIPSPARGSASTIPPPAVPPPAVPATATVVSPTPVLPKTVPDQPSSRPSQQEPQTQALAQAAGAPASVPAAPTEALPAKEPTPEEGTVLVSAAEKLESKKKQLDETITQHLADLQTKTSGLVDHLEKKGIRIGRLTIAFNN